MGDDDLEVEDKFKDKFEDAKESKGCFWAERRNTGNMFDLRFDATKRPPY